VVATRGVIRVQADEIATGIFLAILMYVVVVAAIYAGAFMWMKKKSPPPKE
jgi:flagellar basal body-associated protein FliL